jgi:hypothetical protein
MAAKLIRALLAGRAARRIDALQRQSAMAAKLIRALLAGRAAGRLVSIAPLLNTSSALFLLRRGGREALRRR